MSELIYYDELKDKLLALESEAIKLPSYSEEDYAYNNGVVNGIEACIEELDNIPSVFHKAEDAPKEKSDVLVWFYDYNISSSLLLNDIAVYKNGKFELIDDWFNDIDEKEHPIKIVAWMYYPELPNDFI